MRSELVAGAGLEVFAVVGLILFVVAFVLVAASILSGDRDNYRRWGRIPLDETTEEKRGDSADEMG